MTGHIWVEGPWFLVYFWQAMKSWEFYVLSVAACKYEVLDLLGEVFVIASSDFVKYGDELTAIIDYLGKVTVIYDEGVKFLVVPFGTDHCGS